MGAWGKKLYQNYIAFGVKYLYKELLRDGKTNEEAYNEIVSSNINILKSKYKDEIVMFTLSFGDTLWNYGRLTNEYKETCLTLIEECKKDKIKNKENSYCIYPISELEKLENKLKSEQPQEKKVRKVIPYICDWKDYDTFAYKLESDYAKEKGLYGRYLIIIKIDVIGIPNKCMSPVVWFKITKNEKIPETLEEINELEFVQLISNSYSNKYFLFEERKENILTDEYGYIPIYNGKIITASKRVVPKKLIYIGNFKGLKAPEDENTGFKDICGLYLFWKNFENKVIQKYFDYNKRELRIYREDYIKNELLELERKEREIEEMMNNFRNQKENEE